ncbi:MAG: DUF2165 family protein [Flavisolibacter sp.]
MYSTQFLFRITKLISVAAIGLMSLLIIFGNTTKYYTNYHFLEHVMKMDTISPENHLQYREINNSLLFHFEYIIIILLETIMTFCCVKRSWLLFKNLQSNSKVFNASKNWSVAGILIGIIIWFLGFEIIGGEWFSMWQSSTWKGLGSAERIVSFLVLVLIMLQFEEKDLIKFI